MVSNGFTIADPNDAGMLDVVGFDTATPAVIASFDAAYEKRMCWPSPGTRRPKCVSASTATPASCSRRLRNTSESAQPVIRHASVTLGHA